MGKFSTPKGYSLFASQAQRALKPDAWVEHSSLVDTWWIGTDKIYNYWIYLFSSLFAAALETQVNFVNFAAQLLETPKGWVIQHMRLEDALVLRVMLPLRDTALWQCQQSLTFFARKVAALSPYYLSLVGIEGGCGALCIIAKKDFWTNGKEAKISWLRNGTLVPHT